jgi:alanyl-tRNA synthetase
MMTSRDVRQAFLNYFREREHRVVPSSPLVLPSDPTLLFANAGMNQFKDVFTGREQRDYTRAVTSQKCLRVSGKHNDLEMVGRTPRHHTFFEMLGNFSFGDYFKAEAIEYSWEVITQLFSIPEERLWVTVFAGSENFEADEEAAQLWRDRVGVRPDRILKLGEAENFWRMGDSGPCGPCSEIHYDLGSDLTSVEGVSNPETDEKRYIEIWNLVFMQFNQHRDGNVVPLPSPSIDTGMGLERLVSVIQDKRSNYDTDIFIPILTAAADRAGKRLGEDEGSDFSLRVIADHVRALCFLVTDGVVPSNDKRGYVMRRLLRRAIRHGRKLGIDEPFLGEVVPAVIESLGENYPELIGARDAILEIGLREERRFGETLATGMVMLDQALTTLTTPQEGPAVVPGDVLFQLHDTFGFPLDLARDIAEERGVLLDEAGFEERMASQRKLAQASWKGGQSRRELPLYTELSARYQTAFDGYTQTVIEGTEVLALVKDGQQVDRLENGETGEAVLAVTPFYAEGGGQVGDRGSMMVPDGQAIVMDTRQPASGMIVHDVRVEAGALVVGQQAKASVDEQRRLAIRRNHTATHLLHAALREVVGKHVKQAGSLVAPDRLRFDFSHFAPVGTRALEDIETLVNQSVLADLAVQSDVVSIEQALESGAMALFGERYGEKVRVVRAGDVSMELCGGTHSSRTGELGLFKLAFEHGVASGTRRIEAITGMGSLERFRSDQRVVRALEDRLSVTREDLVSEIEKRLGQAKQLQKDLEQQKLAAVRADLMQKAEQAPEVAGVKVMAARLDNLAPQEMRELADLLRQKLGSGVVVLGRAEDTKASLLVAVTRDTVNRLHAGKLVRSLGAIIGGGGGGRPELAEAGGKQPERLDEALAAVIETVRNTLEAGQT